jgi:histidine phosphotransferase ChpT
MTERTQPTDLELAALISSNICHDVIGPVGAIYNGLEILDEDDNAEAKSYALDVIRNVTEQASARLQFARFAFGAAGSAGAQIELATAEQISRGLMGQGKHSKHKLAWRGIPGQMAKDKVKLLLNLVASAVTALPRGGEIEVAISGSLDKPSFMLRCKGVSARPPQYLSDYVTGGQAPQLDALSIQAYYTWRLAASSRMRLDIAKDGADVLLSARPLG